MSMESHDERTRYAWLAALAIAMPGWSEAQVPVNESGEPIPVEQTSSEEIPLLGLIELEELVGPIALYPDDLLAIVLPAATYPLQLVQADRFLQDLKNDSSLEPDDAWDDSIVALLNYPEAIELLTDELDKTWRLGEAVVAQQADVVAAIESFRDQAYTAGNLKSDAHQTVSQSEGVIEITPVEEDVIYVPYYDPERVVVYQPSPAYYYYPRAYPVYYYPYAYGHSFRSDFFWGVTTAFTVGWLTDSLHVYHHSYYGHPYHGHYYGHNYWYRNHSIRTYNNYYYSNHNNYYSGDRYGRGDRWRPHSGSTVNHHDQRVTRNRHYPGRRGSGTSEVRQSSASAKFAARSPDIKFRQRSTPTSNQASSTKPRRESSSKPSIKFRERADTMPRQVAANTSTRPSRGVEPTRSSKPTRSNQSTRSSKPSGSSVPARSSQSKRSSRPKQVSQPKRSSQPKRVSQPKRSSQPSRSSQPARSSKPPKSAANKSGSKQGPGASGGRKERGKSRRR